MRRWIPLCAGLALLLVLSGCDLKQVFLADVELEIDFLPGVWTKFICIDFAGSPYEIRAGEYNVSGKFIQTAKLPKKLKVRYQTENSEGQASGRMTHQYRIAADGSFASSYRLKEDYVVPVGHYLCLYLLPKRNALLLGTVLEFFNWVDSSLVGAGATDRLPEQAS